MEWRERIIAHTPDEVRQYLQAILNNLIEYPANMEPSRRGFVTVVVEDMTGEIVLPPLFVGDIPLNKVLPYLFFATEKVVRLGEHPDHLTSRASHDPDSERKPLTDRKYGGAVRSPRFLRVGTSGLPWVGDQAVSVALLDRMGLITDELLNSIERESDDKATRAFVLYDRERRPTA